MLDGWEQCIGLPGEISRQAVQHLQRSCLDHGCYALNQLQCLLRVGRQAESVVERLLLRLDEQGLGLSSPWPQRKGTLIAEAVWPKIWATWTEIQKWAGCSELGDELTVRWQRVRQCLSACKKLGRAQILTVQQLRSGPGRWRHVDELRHNHRLLTADEYALLTSWLDAAGLDSEEAMAMDEHVSVPAATWGVPPQGQPMACTAYFGVMPPCIRGSVALQSVDGQVELEHLPDGDMPEQ